MLSEDLSNGQAGLRWLAHYIVARLSRLKEGKQLFCAGVFRRLRVERVAEIVRRRLVGCRVREAWVLCQSLETCP